MGKLGSAVILVGEREERFGSYCAFCPEIGDGAAGFLMSAVSGVFSGRPMREEEIKGVVGQKRDDCLPCFVVRKRRLFGFVVEIGDVAGGFELGQDIEELGGAIRVTATRKGNDVPMPVGPSDYCTAGPKRFVVRVGNDDEGTLADSVIEHIGGVNVSHWSRALLWPRTVCHPESTSPWVALKFSQSSISETDPSARAIEVFAAP